MAVRIRLKRLGKKKQPFYRIVVADSRAPRDGRSIETLGHYNPLPEQEQLVIKEERLFHWLDQGAEPSDTVKSLFRNRGLILKYELISRNADEATISKEMNKWELAREERVKRQSAAADEKAEQAEKAKAEEAAAEEAADAEAEVVPEETAEAVEEPSDAPAEDTTEEAADEAAVEEPVSEESAEITEETATDEAPSEEEAAEAASPAEAEEDASAEAEPAGEAQDDESKEEAES